MRTLQAKLNSQRGASLLLALLFFLIALLVGASILMAAASNGGKLKSNVDEQQAYLTLSSAMQLVADELDGATYTGKYQYTRTGRGSRNRPYSHIYTQRQGECTSQFLTSFLPEMEQNFSEVCKGKVPQSNNQNTYEWKPLSTTAMGLPRTETVTLQVSGGADDKYRAITAETVKVELAMNNDFSIQARATITEGSFTGYSMVAEFHVTENPFFMRSNSNETDNINQSVSEALFTWQLKKMAKGWA